jgi:hypothetical protein
LDEQGQGQKSEPYIEKNAENYCVPCYQKNNIVPFLKSTEKYLFLFTTCKSRCPEMARFFGRRFIVGYIIKQRCLERYHQGELHYAVQGKTKLVAFREAFDLKNLDSRPRHRHIRVRLVNAGETKSILRRLDQGKNVLKQCLGELRRVTRLGCSRSAEKQCR